MAVRQALSRLTREGELVRPAQGVYARPKPNRWFGTAEPNPADVARVIASRNAERIEVHGAKAARRFGLSTQVPVKTAFYTTGPTRTMNVGNTVVIFKHMAPRYLRFAGTEAGKAIVALLHMGREHVTPGMVRHVFECLEPVDQIRFRTQVETLPAWLRDLCGSAVAPEGKRA